MKNNLGISKKINSQPPRHKEILGILRKLHESLQKTNEGLLVEKEQDKCDLFTTFQIHKGLIPEQEIANWISTMDFLNEVLVEDAVHIIFLLPKLWHTKEMSQINKACLDLLYKKINIVEETINLYISFIGPRINEVNKKIRLGLIKPTSSSLERRILQMKNILKTWKMQAYSREDLEILLKFVTSYSARVDNLKATGFIAQNEEHLVSQAVYLLKEIHLKILRELTRSHLY